jgi:hypothetical protein
MAEISTNWAERQLKVNLERRTMKDMNISEGLPGLMTHGSELMRGSHPSPIVHVATALKLRRVTFNLVTKPGGHTRSAVVPSGYVPFTPGAEPGTSGHGGVLHPVHFQSS